MSSSIHGERRQSLTNATRTADKGVANAPKSKLPAVGRPPHQQAVGIAALDSVFGSQAPTPTCAPARSGRVAPPSVTGGGSPSFSATLAAIGAKCDANSQTMEGWRQRAFAPRPQAGRHPPLPKHQPPPSPINTTSARSSARAPLSRRPPSGPAQPPPAAAPAKSALSPRFHRAMANLEVGQSTRVMLK